MVLWSLLCSSGSSPPHPSRPAPLHSPYRLDPPRPTSIRPTMVLWSLLCFSGTGKRVRRSGKYRSTGGSGGIAGQGGQEAGGAQVCGQGRGHCRAGCAGGRAGSTGLQAGAEELQGWVGRRPEEYRSAGGGGGIAGQGGQEARRQAMQCRGWSRDWRLATWMAATHSLTQPSCEAPPPLPAPTQPPSQRVRLPHPATAPRPPGLVGSAPTLLSADPERPLGAKL